MTILHLLLLSIAWTCIAGIVCLIKKNNGLIDIFWGIGFLWISTWSMSFDASVLMPRILLNSLVWIWGLRLSGYLFLRNWDKPEDFRYREWRKDWGKNWIIQSILKIYVLQGLLLALISFPIYWINTHATLPGFLNSFGLPFIFIFGATLSFLGIVVETIADLQKSNFKKKPSNAGKICKDGLWSISRHPNYLGEILMWSGIGIAALVFRQGYLGLIGPLSIIFLLYRVSGVPLLEAKMKDNSEFQAYVKTTGAIFPRFFN
jgi:steroid 5-alpha reductase family enzyme